MKRKINKEEFLKLYERHQEYLIEGGVNPEKRLVWDFEIDFVLDFDFPLNLSRADLSRANLSEANLSEANLSRADLSRANLSRANLSRADLRGSNLDYSCLPLWCGSKGMILCDNLQAQLLGHIMDACRSVEFTDKQKEFVRNNWNRTKEFLGDDF